MAFDLIALATAAVTAGVSEITRRVFTRRQRTKTEPGEVVSRGPAERPGGVSFGNVSHCRDVAQAGGDLTVHRGRPE
ncbi:hypothetical protein [Krasilnikovia sp. MM14-A1259]|uniref:hypothetical protein n=1 Tax=Krasilnikovia sp. MM14-A1259 TaxID=3373539 RepID=UPI0038188615